MKPKVVLSHKPIIPVPALPAIAHYSWDIEDEYDPKNPNDYDKIIKERREKQADQKKRSDRKRKNSPSYRAVAATKNSDDEEDYNKYTKVGKAMIAPPKSLQQSSVPTDASGSVAEKIMAKYGWNSNKGLGKDEQGMASALLVEKTSKRGGRIIHESEFKEPQLMPPPSSIAIPGSVTPVPVQMPEPQLEETITEIIKRPSKVVLLRNMVGPGDVDEELEPEVKEECITKYGEVQKVIIRELENVVPEEAIRIFVEFKRIESAIKAVVDLNGRFFGGRQVRAGFYSIEKFENLQLLD